MKRLKRNRIQRAFDKGYQLGLAGRSKENCPFLTGLARSKWLEGWREGRNDWREGLTDALSCSSAWSYCFLTVSRPLIL